MSPQDKRLPAAIRRRPGALEIVWDAALPPVTVASRKLRLACPCAACVEEMTGRKLLDPAQVPEDVDVTSLELVGAYGLRIRWSDGHGTGIYTFAQLASI